MFLGVGEGEDKRKSKARMWLNIRLSCVNLSQCSQYFGLQIPEFSASMNLQSPTMWRRAGWSICVCVKSLLGQGTLQKWLGRKVLVLSEQSLSLLFFIEAPCLFQASAWAIVALNKAAIKSSCIFWSGLLEARIKGCFNKRARSLGFRQGVQSGFEMCILLVPAPDHLVSAATPRVDVFY